MKRNCYKWMFLWFLILGSLAGCSRQDSCFMKIGNYSVEKEEYALLAYDNISLAALEYGQKYQMDVNADGFWTEEKNGKTPIDYVRELTDKNIIRQKGVQILAQEEGLISDISFTAFQKQYEEENRQRKEKSNRNEVIYGPMYLTEAQYYSYRQSMLEQTLLETLEQKIIISQDELKEHYLVMNDTEGKKNFQAELLITEWKTGAPGQTTTRSLELNSLELGKENLILDRITEAAKELEVGETSSVLELDSGMEGTIQIITKNYVPFGSFEDTKNIVEQQLREIKAKESIDEKINGFEVIRGDKYDRLSYEDMVN